MSDSEEIIKAHVSKYTKNSMVVQLDEDITSEQSKNIFALKCLTRPMKTNSKKILQISTKLDEIPLEVFQILFDVEVSQYFLDSIIDNTPIEKPAPPQPKREEPQHRQEKPKQNERRSQEKPKKEPTNDSQEIELLDDDDAPQQTNERDNRHNHANHRDNYEPRESRDPPPPPPPNKRYNRPLPIPRQEQYQNNTYDNYQHPQHRNGNYRKSSPYFDDGGDNEYQEKPSYAQYKRGGYSRSERNQFYSDGRDDDGYDNERRQSRIPPKYRPSNPNPEPRRQEPVKEPEQTFSTDDFPALSSNTPMKKQTAWGQSQEPAKEEDKPEQPPTQVESKPTSNAWASISKEDEEQQNDEIDDTEFWEKVKDDADGIVAKHDGDTIYIGGGLYDCDKAKKTLIEWYKEQIVKNYTTTHKTGIETEDVDQMFKTIKRIEFK